MFHSAGEKDKKKIGKNKINGTKVKQYHDRKKQDEGRFLIYKTLVSAKHSWHFFQKSRISNRSHNRDPENSTEKHAVTYPPYIID